MCPCLHKTACQGHPLSCHLLALYHDLGGFQSARRRSQARVDGVVRRTSASRPVCGRLRTYAVVCRSCNPNRLWARGGGNWLPQAMERRGGLWSGLTGSQHPETVSPDHPRAQVRPGSPRGSSGSVLVHYDARPCGGPLCQRSFSASAGAAWCSRHPLSRLADPAGLPAHDSCPRA